MKFYKRLSLLLSLGIMGIGLTTFSIDAADAQRGLPDFMQWKAERVEADDNIIDIDDPVTAVGTCEDAGSDDGYVVAELEAEPETEPEVPNYLTLISEDSDVYRLIRRYLDAKLIGTREAFEGVVTDTSIIDPDDLQRRTGAIVDYKNLVCYTKRGTGCIDYVVIYTYQMDIVTIETPIDSIDMMYVQYDDYGDPLVFVGDLDDTTSITLLSMVEDNDVTSIVNETYQKMDDAMRSDANLKAFWQRLYAAQ